MPGHAYLKGDRVTTSTVWISYDLGVRGDYESIYSWLDAHGAKECGDSLAVLTYRHDGQLIDKLKADLILDDVQTRIQYLVTFNRRDFVDICAKRRIELWTE
jgi:hypothetical protein